MGPHGDNPGRIASGAPPAEDREIDLDVLARVTALYGRVLTEETACAIAALETEYPRWHAWPHIGYRQNGIFYVKRNNTAMNVIVVRSVAEIRPAIEAWLNDNQNSYWGPR
jgi:hypothetical protein